MQRINRETWQWEAAYNSDDSDDDEGKGSGKGSFLGKGKAWLKGKSKDTSEGDEAAAAAGSAHEQALRCQAAAHASNQLLHAITTATSPEEPLAADDSKGKAKAKGKGSQQQATIRSFTRPSPY